MGGTVNEFLSRYVSCEWTDTTGRRTAPAAIPVASRQFGPRRTTSVSSDTSRPCASFARDSLAHASPARPVSRPPALYTAEQRRRRDQSPWTLVQGVLAPLQFLAFLVSLVLVLRFLATGHGYGLATASVVVKTGLLYLIMVTGSVWEKEVFGRYLFAPAFLWEDLFGFLVLGLHTAYLAALLTGALGEAQLMQLALCAYLSYLVNATQFVLKMRAARRELPLPAAFRATR